MPIYTYHCSLCKHTFEVIQSLSEKPLEECLNCKGYLEKIVSLTSPPQFKGPGFHATDYPKKKK